MGISSTDNKIFVSGDFLSEDMPRLLAAIHSAVEKRGYRDIHLDFSQCTKTFSPQMLVISAYAQSCWKKGIDVSLTLPVEQDLRRLFINANWAHFIDVHQFEGSRYRGYTHAPAIKFSTGKEQAAAVDKAIDILMAAISHFRRDDVRYMEWALNELTDNVINHSQSDVGGFLQVTNFRKREQVEITVCDWGLGIPGTLRPTHPDLRTDLEALEAAIKEGVTRDKKIGQGNGLYGTWRITKQSGGHCHIYSNYGRLTSTESNGLHLKNEMIPMHGTLVVAAIGYSKKHDLSDALRISGKAHTPVDYIETHYQEDETGNVVFKLRAESEGFGSRAAGSPVRAKLVNLVGFINSSAKITVDLEDVHLVSSSFADEVFGKLMLELGPVKFMQRISLTNVDPLVQGLIDKAIAQRLAQGTLN